MNEVRDLVNAFDIACELDQRCAISTIVEVNGSSYRRPGARMLICETGDTTGSISAGCLESDVIEHAKQVIVSGIPKLVEYNTSSTSDEMAWGLGLGCNGVIRILIEPTGKDSLYIQALRHSLVSESPGSLTVITVYGCTSQSRDVQNGSRLFIQRYGAARRERLQRNTANRLAAVIEAIGHRSGTATFELSEFQAKVFIETLMPPVPVVIFGAGQDALPIAELAQRLGWTIEIVDPQCREISISRFNIADRVTLVRPEDIGDTINITSQTMAVVMSHNYDHDLAILGTLLQSPAGYIGIMGPRKRTERMLDQLGRGSELLGRVYSPVGLDIGASGPTEIALSIVSEIRAVLAGRSGRMLGSRAAPFDAAAKQEFRTNNRQNDAQNIAG
jgi:xanthine dehydrogenase accessory factor